MEQEIYGMQKKSDTTLWGVVIIIAIALTVVYLIDTHAQSHYQEAVDMQSLYQN